MAEMQRVILSVIAIEDKTESSNGMNRPEGLMYLTDCSLYQHAAAK
jgi:hypothetical protein